MAYKISKTRACFCFWTPRGTKCEPDKRKAKRLSKKLKGGKLRRLSEPCVRFPDGWGTAARGPVRRPWRR